MSDPTHNGKCLGSECHHQKANTATQQILNAGRSIVWDLVRFDISKRQGVVLTCIWISSVGVGRRSVIIPKWETFSDLTGLPASHITTTIRELLEMRMIEFLKREGGGYEIRLQLDTNLWHCRPRQMRSKVNETKEWIHHCNPTEGHQAPEAAWTDEKKQESQLNFDPLPDTTFLDLPLTETVKLSTEVSWQTEWPAEMT